MLQYAWLFPLGMLVGLFDTLIRAGGGVVLMPILLVAYPAERPEILARIALAVLFVNAIPGSVRHAHRQQIDYQSGIVGALAIMPGVVIGALLTTAMSRRTLVLLFGLLLLLTAIFLLAHHRLQPLWQRLRHGHRLQGLLAAEGTIHFVLAVLALTGVLVHLVTDGWHSGLWRTGVLGIGMLCGVHLGRLCSPSLHSPWIMRSSAIALGGVGLWLLSMACS
jgi:uncharacterized membrane protein YfcA